MYLISQLPCPQNGIKRKLIKCYSYAKFNIRNYNIDIYYNIETIIYIYPIYIIYVLNNRGKERHLWVKYLHPNKFNAYTLSHKLRTTSFQYHLILWENESSRIITTTSSHAKAMFKTVNIVRSRRKKELMQILDNVYGTDHYSKKSHISATT